MVDANEGKNLVHALQNKKREAQRRAREKKKADMQIIVKTGPNSFEIRDKTPEELAAEKLAAEEKAKVGLIFTLPIQSGHLGLGFTLCLLFQE